MCVTHVLKHHVLRKDRSSFYCISSFVHWILYLSTYSQSSNTALTISGAAQTTNYVSPARMGDVCDGEKQVSMGATQDADMLCKGELGIRRDQLWGGSRFSEEEEYVSHRFKEIH